MKPRYIIFLLYSLLCWEQNCMIFGKEDPEKQ